MDFLNTYTLGDSFPVMAKIPDKSVDLVFTSPPDLSQTNYDKASIDGYRDLQKRAMDEFARVVKDDGFVVVCQTDRKVNAVVLCNHWWYIKCLQDAGLKLKDYKIVVRNSIDHRSMYYFGFQHYVCFTRTGTIARKGEFLRDIIVDQQEKVLNQSVWSQDFCRLVIENLTKPGDLVIDPFAGVGPVLYAAEQLGRKYWGAEIEPKFYNKDFASYGGVLPV